MADGIELGKAYVQIVPSAKGIKDSIAEELGGESSRAGESAGQLFTGKLVGTIKTVLGTAAIGKMISDSVNAGGALQQSLGGIETLFKDSVDKVKTTQTRWVPRCRTSRTPIRALQSRTTPCSTTSSWATAVRRLRCSGC